MNGQNFSVALRSSNLDVGMIVRLSLALLVTLANIALAWIILGLTGAHAAGVIETPTQATPWAVAFDSSGHVWVAEPGCDAEPQCNSAFPSYIGKYNVSNDTLVKNFLEPSGFSSPVFLLVDPHGNVWFSEPTTDAIGRLTPSTKTGPLWKQWTVPTAKASPYDLVLDNSAGGPIPHLITADSAGRLWYSEGFSGDIGTFNPTTRVHKNIDVAVGACPSPTPGVTPTPCPAETHISGIGVDSTGRIWYDDSLNALVGVYTPASGALKTLTLSNPNAHPYDGLAVDSANNTWFTEEFASPSGNLGKIPVGTL